MKTRIIITACLLLLFLGSRAQISGPVSFCVTDNNPNKQYNVSFEDWTDKYSISEVEWDFGDGTAPIKAVYYLGDGKSGMSHIYKERGSYVITVKALKNDGTEIAANRRTYRIKVKGCRLPVNHNITTMKY